MSDETTAPTGAPPAASAEPVTTETPQENTAPPANADGQSEPAKDDKPRDDKGRFVQERINELTKARRQAERERDAIAEQLRAIQSQQPAPAPVSDRPPTPADFNYDLDAWGAAVTAHAVKQAESRAESKFSERQQFATRQQVFEQYAERERAYAATDPDYLEAVESLRSSIRFHDTTLEVIAASEHGPAVLKHLGTHIDVADRIARLPAHLAAAEIARIEAVVKAPKAKPVSQAPAPAPQVGGGAAVSKDPERMSTDEWVRWRNDQLKQR